MISNLVLLHVLLLVSPGILYENPTPGAIRVFESGKVVEVLPGVGYIILITPEPCELKFFDLEGKFLATLKTDVRPDKIYELDGQIFLNCVLYKDHNYYPELWMLDASLKIIRKVKGISLYSPNKLGGKWYGYDLIKNYNSRLKRPKMARRFDPATSTFEDEAFFKMPSKYRNMKMHYKEYWLYPFGDVLVVVMQWDSELFLLDPEYLSREKLDQDEVVTPAPKAVPLVIPGGFHNQGVFREDLDLLAIDEARRRIRLWLAGQSYISTSWKNLDGIIFSVTSVQSNQSSLFLLKPSFEAKFIKSVPGMVLAGKGQGFWSRTDTAVGIEVNSYVLKER